MVRVDAGELVKAIRAGEPVEASNVTVDGNLDCNGLRYSRPLVIRDAVLTGLTDFSDCQFDALVDLTGCIFQGPIRLSRSQFAKRLLLNNVTMEAAEFDRLRVEADVEAQGLHAGGEMNLRDAQIAGSLKLQSVAARQTILEGRLNLIGAKIGGDLNLKGIRSKEICLYYSEIAGSVLLQPEAGHRSSVERDLLLDMARIGRFVGLSGIELKGVLSGMRLTVGAEFICASEEDHVTEFGANVDLFSVSIGGRMVMEGIRVVGDLSITDSCTKSLSLNCNQQRTHIGGNLIFLGNDISGSVWLAGAHISGSFLGRRSTMAELVAYVPHLPRTEIEGNVDLRNIRVLQDILFVGCRIRGDFLLNSAVVEGNLQCGCLEGARTEFLGSLYFSDATLSGGAYLEGAQIGGTFLAMHTRLGNLSMIQAGEHCTEVGSGLLLYASKVSGTAALQGAKVKGTVNLTYTEFQSLVIHDSEISRALVADNSRAVSFQLDGRSVEGGKVSLQRAKIGALILTEKIPAAMELAGCDAQDLVAPGDDYRALAASTSPFRVSAYTAIEKWLRDRGDEKLANQIYVDMRRRRRRETLRGVHRLGDWFLDWSTLYGIAAYRLLAYLAAVTLLSAWTFSQPGALRHEPPTSSAPGVAEAAWVAARTTFPMFAVPAARMWHPTANAVRAGGWQLPIGYDGYASAVSLTSWLVVPLFVASLAGLLRKQK